MSEADLWTELDLLMRNLWHATRVESHALSAGIPDVDFCFHGDGHIELKFGHAEIMPRFRHSQIRWITERTNHHGHVLLLSKVIVFGDAHYLWHKGEQISELDKNRKYSYWVNHRMNIDHWRLNNHEAKTILSGGVIS